jgi:hypothetical protein
MTTNPSNTRKRSARKAAAKTETTNVVELPKGRTPRKRSAASVKADIVEALAAEAPKARKRVAKAAAAAPVERPQLNAEQVAVLQSLASNAKSATDELEAEVVSLLQAGVSPSHVGAAIHLGNSSIRRIGWRHGVGVDPNKR